MMFQMTFFMITPALIVGAFVDRMKFSPMLVFMILWSLIVYAPIAHWVWASTGFLFSDGVLDFAGGTVVHINAGIAGLVCCLVLGKRIGYGQRADGAAQSDPDADRHLAAVGRLVRLQRRLGAGRRRPRRHGLRRRPTSAPPSAAVAWMLVEWVAKGKPAVLGIASGAVAGLVAITPAAGLRAAERRAGDRARRRHRLLLGGDLAQAHARLRRLAGRVRRARRRAASSARS